jgi:hypothetical protein
VEVALEAPAGGVAGLDDARARGGQLVARVGARERERDELGEALETLLGVRGERLLALRRGDQQAPYAPRDDDGRGDDRSVLPLARAPRDLARPVRGTMLESVSPSTGSTVPRANAGVSSSL